MPVYQNKLADALRGGAAPQSNSPYNNALADLLNTIPTPPQRNVGLASGFGINALNLTPQERNLYNHHVDNMNYGRTVNNSSILQMVVDGPDGQVYNIPTVWDGKILSPEQAYKRAASIGWDHWPSYGPVHSRAEEAKLKAMGKPTNYDIADARYMQMHKYLDRDPPAMVKQPIR